MVKAWIIYSKDWEYDDNFAESYLKADSLDSVLSQIGKYEKILDVKPIELSDVAVKELMILGYPFHLWFKPLQDYGILFWKVNVLSFSKAVSGFQKVNQAYKDFIAYKFKNSGRYHLKSLTHYNDIHIRIAVKY